MSTAPSLYPWWDDALEVARVRTIFTGRRHRVRSWLGYWIIEEALA